MKALHKAPLLLALFATAALAQSSPNLVPGQTPTAGQWNSYFAAKQDYSPVLSQVANGTIPATGQLQLRGTSSGLIAIKPQGAAGTYNFNLPTSAGTAGYALVSGGGGGAPMTWQALSGSGTVTSVGLSMPAIFSTSGSPVTSTGTITATLLTQPANRLFVGPASGLASIPTFRALVGADLPLPGASSLGGVFSIAAATHLFLTSIGTDGTPAAARPSCADLSDAGAGCSGAAGGVTSIAGTANQVAASASTGAVTLSLPSALVAPGSLAVSGLAGGGTQCLQIDNAGLLAGIGGACGTGTGNALFGSPSGNTSGHVVTMSNTTVGVADSGTALSSLVTLTGSQTLTNKTLTSPAVNAPTIVGGTASGLSALSVANAGTGAFNFSIGYSGTLSAGHQLTFDLGNADRTVTLGGAVTTAGALSTSGAFALTLTATGATNVTLPTTGTLATLAGSETLANKTLTAPVVATISNTGTLTLPTSTDVLVGRATTDTLTNKSISGASNTLSNIGNSALTNSSTTVNGQTCALGSTCTITAAAAAGTLTGTTLASNVVSSSLTSAAGGAFGTAAFAATGTSGAAVPLLNAANTWSAAQTIGVTGKGLTLNGVTTAAFMSFASSGTDKAYFGYDIAGGNIISPAAANTVGLRNDNGAVQFSANNSGNLSISFSGAYASCTALTTNASSVVGCTVSDARLKRERGKITGAKALDALARIEPRRYSFKDPRERGTASGTHYGFYAQDVARVFPELVTVGAPTRNAPDGVRQFDKAEMIAVLWAQNRALLARIEKLEHRR